MTAIRAGAHHVTAAERWLYLASACKDVLVANGSNDSQAKVVYKRPSDLALLEDVPIVCNLLVAEIFDDGLLSSGLVPAISHALNNFLLTHDAIVIPAAATVYMQVRAGPTASTYLMPDHHSLPSRTTGRGVQIRLSRADAGPWLLF